MRAAHRFTQYRMRLWDGHQFGVRVEPFIVGFSDACHLKPLVRTPSALLALAIEFAKVGPWVCLVAMSFCIV